jgi:feruloyl esterase
MLRGRLALLLVASALGLFALSRAEAGDTPCDRLNLPASIPGQILQRRTVASGAFQAEGGALLQNLPVFCRVVAALSPVSGSAIRIEVWLPLRQWNSKFLGVGNGGFSGSISYSALAEGVKRGYATASTNTGHDGNSGRFALGQPQKVIDFGYRAVHEMTQVSKHMIADFYGHQARFAYWNGCSAGGRQGLQSAQRYPADYDGIVAGAPALDWTGRASSALRVAHAMRAQRGAALDENAMQTVHRGALAACDADDGLMDEVISNPSQCGFDPQVMQCGPNRPDNCLQPVQVTAVRAIYASPPNPDTGRLVTGLYPGSELGWNTWAGSEPFATAVEHFRYVMHGDENWSPDTFRFERDVSRAEALDGNTINALNADLRPYFRRGGKLIQYHGWSDPQISPGASPQYFESVVRRIGKLKRVQDNYRLFMVPGMAHCAGGEGADRFDMLAALENWVERGNAPDQIPAWRERGGRVDRTRNLCPYPLVSRFLRGDADNAESFRCVTQ